MNFSDALMSYSSGAAPTPRITREFPGGQEYDEASPPAVRYSKTRSRRHLRGRTLPRKTANLKKKRARRRAALLARRPLSKGGGP